MDTPTPPPLDPAFVDAMPYFDEYLDQVLRPRIERFIDKLDAKASDMAWKYLTEKVLADQKHAASPEAVRALLEQKLGLSLHITVHGSFNRPSGAAAPAEQSGAITESKPRPQVVSRGMPDNPLARAVSVRRADETRA